LAPGRTLQAAFAAFAAVAAQAEPVVVSKAADSISVTVYRDPSRQPNHGIEPDSDMLNGFALITETRTVDLPPGPVTVRFEGVASGIQPETALITGLDGREKNHDRQLLSPRALVDAFTGQRVTLRRTDKRTGRTVEQPALIRSGANGIIVQTAAGFEALSCTGLNETLLYPNVPQGVSAKPVLSVASADQSGGKRTLTLSYLTGNFDWQANYVGELAPDGGTLSLFAWVTLASRDDTAFVGAEANAVAGRVARVEHEDNGDTEDEDEEERGRVLAECWPDARTAKTLPLPPAMPARRISTNGIIAIPADEMSAAIVVTGSRIARLEALGDLKLYRIPFAVTVAARSQKQVAFLSKPLVRGELLYRSDIGSSDEGDEPRLLYRFRNRKEAGAGDPLPAGKVALFQTVGGRRMLIGETAIEDKAVGEEVELRLPEATNVTVETEDLEEGDKWTRRKLTVRNANPFPVLYEARFRDDSDARFTRFGDRLAAVDGRRVWRVRVPANGEATLSFRKEELES
jgi:hypothetical protein